MTGNEIRERFLEHFRSRDHLVLESASLVPFQDPTTLFTSAGMQPLKPFFQGLSRPPAPRLTSSQKCFRTQDLEEVGRTDRHQTFFEMLGNFAPSGDYFKELAIPYAWELVIDGFGLPKDRIRVTVHPSDDEAARIWTTATDIRPDWVYRNPENWWSAGETGPCGPDSELWYDRGPGYGCGRDDCYPDHCERFLEFWNLVFMQFDKQPDGSMPPLPKPGTDTGMGLERISSILQGVDNNFDTDLFQPLMGFVRESSAESRIGSERLISDHLRAMAFVIGDGVLPGNEGRGYVLRRLMRRALLHRRRIGMKVPLADGVDVVVEVMGGQYPELRQRSTYIKDTITTEAERFNRTLEQGMELFERIAARHGQEIPGEDAFRLHDTFGFPLELTRELAEERALTVDVAGFQHAMAAQRQRSRSMSGQRWVEAGDLPRSRFDGYRHLVLETRVSAIRRGGEAVPSASEGDEIELFLEETPFYAESGGQIGDTGTVTGPTGQVQVEDTQKPSEGVIAHLARVLVGQIEVGQPVRAAVEEGRRRQIARHHSATHLLHKALRETLGDQAVQRGSWVGPDHTTFDFPLNRALGGDELSAIQRRVNQQVRAALPFQESIKPYKEAVAGGAMHLFEEKYGDTVRVVCFGDWTCELCGGTHVENTADVGTVLVVAESSVGAGIRRLDLVAGEAAEALIERRLGAVASLARELGVPPDQLTVRVGELRAQLKELERNVRRLQDEVRAARVRGPEGGPERHDINGIPVIAEVVESEKLDDLRSYADSYLELLGGRGIVAVLGGDLFVIKVSRDLVSAQVDANRLRAAFGTGGGQPHLVQGRRDQPPEKAIPAFLEMIRNVSANGTA